MENTKESNYTMSEGYSLPSKGLIYDKPFSPIVALRSMTTREEMKRLSPSNTPYKLLSDIIEDCLVTKLPMHVYDLCLGDYEYLLHKLRVVSHGPEYKMSVVCPNCGSRVDTVINLDDIETLDYKVEDWKNLLHLKLPKSNHDIVLKYETPRMLDEIALKTADLKKKTKDATIDYELLVTLESVIDTVDGQKLGYVDQETFINQLPVSDMDKILNQIQKINKQVGLKTDSIQVKCDNCGYEISTFFRFGSEFFRPTED
jgi:DNA-directed RNA polymerase subunit RPC12/RpoP